MAIPNFGSQSNFGDWTRYAGLDPTKPMMGIAPVFGESDFSKKPVIPTIAQVGQRIQSAGSELAQGNFSNAAKTFATGGIAPIVSAAPSQNVATQQKDLNGDGMISDWEE